MGDLNVTFGFSLRAGNGDYADREEVVLLVSFFRTWTFILWRSKKVYPDLLLSRLQEKPKWWHREIGAAVMLRENYRRPGGKALRVYFRFLRWGFVKTWTIWKGRPSPEEADGATTVHMRLRKQVTGVPKGDFSKWKVDYSAWQPMRHHEMGREEIFTTLVCVCAWAICYVVWGASILGDWAPAVGLVAAGCSVLISGAWMISRMDRET